MHREVVEILLYIPQPLINYQQELKSFILDIEDSIDINIVEEISNNTNIVISLVSTTLNEFDEEFYKRYKDNKLKSLFYYFDDVEIDIDELNDDIFKRIEFKDSLAIDNKLCNNLSDIKESLAVYIKETIFDIVNKTNYRKINSSVISRSKGSRFYDNDNNLRKVDNFLRRAKRVSLINGFGGVGKTTLAIEYAKDALENEIYDYLIWLDIEKGIDSEIRTFAIKFLLSDMEDGKQEFIYYKRTFERFIAKYPNSLIILDNYTQSKEYQEKLQHFLKNFSSTDIIITSREDISKIVDSKPIKLEVFQNIDDALEMFKLNSTRSYSIEQLQIIKKIIDYLGNLPLALEITANFLSDTQMSLEEYLKALQKEGLQLFSKISDYSPQNHLEGLIATLKINSKIKDNEDSLNLLKAFALISPEPINQTIIEEYLVKELNISEFDKTVSLRDLEKFSYIKLSKDNYSIHRLLQQSIVNEFFKNNQDEQKEILIKISLAIFYWFKNSFDEFKYGTYFSETVKHIDYLLEEWSNIIPNKAEIYLYTCLSAYSLNPKKSLVNINKVIDLAERVEIKEIEKTIIYNQYGTALELNSKYTKALEYYTKALDINILDDNKQEIAISYNNIGNIYVSNKDYNKALEYYNKSLNIKLNNLISNHPSIAISYGNIGSLYLNKEEYDNALKYYHKSLKINLLVFRSNHPSISTTYNNIGTTYGNKKNYKEALKYFTKSLDIKLQTIGSYHSNTAITYINLGLVYKDLKECKKAKEYLQKALDIQIILEINEDIFELKNTIKEIDRNIKKEQKAKFNKKGRYCKDA